MAISALQYGDFPRHVLAEISGGSVILGNRIRQRHRQAESNGGILATRILLVALAFGASVVIAGSVFAEQLKATLDGKSEVPPNGSKATGMAELDYDPASRKLTWKITFTDLSGPLVAAHFHGPAQPGKTGSVAVKLGGAGPSPLVGSATLTDAQAADLLAGTYYINIHTAKHPSGEIRGQVTRQ